MESVVVDISFVDEWFKTAEAVLEPLGLIVA